MTWHYICDLESYSCAVRRRSVVLTPSSFRGVAPPWLVAHFCLFRNVAFPPEILWDAIIHPVLWIWKWVSVRVSECACVRVRVPVRVPYWAWISLLGLCVVFLQWCSNCACALKPLERMESAFSVCSCCQGCWPRGLWGPLLFQNVSQSSGSVNGFLMWLKSCGGLGDSSSLSFWSAVI